MGRVSYVSLSVGCSVRPELHAVHERWICKVWQRQMWRSLCIRRNHSDMPT